MMKLEHNEVALLLQIIENATFEGKIVPVLAPVIEKLQKEFQKTAPDTVIRG